MTYEIDDDINDDSEELDFSGASDEIGHENDR